MHTEAPTTRAPRVTAAAEAALRRRGIWTNPYFTGLEGGALGRDGFRRSQEQFYFAVLYFPRPMAGLLARLPDPSTRLDLLHNLVEEHGDFRPDAFHEATFRRFLRSIGAHPDPLRGVREAPEVHAFNVVLTAACQCEEPEVGVGCLGVIEHAFADISAAIGRAVVRRGWVTADELVHYKLHAAIDRRHAEEFFAVVEPAWDDPGRRRLIERGLDLGAYAFDRLYCDLYALAMEGDGSKT
jgi:pyrroloquinoline-quinone synthase